MTHTDKHYEKKITYNGEDYYVFYDIRADKGTIKYPDGTSKNVSSKELYDFLDEVGDSSFKEKKQLMNDLADSLDRKLMDNVIFVSFKENNK